MKTLRLAFLLPALIAATPAVAAPKLHARRAAHMAPRNLVVHHEGPVRYVRLEQLIRSFAERARAERGVSPGAVMAQR